MSLNGVTPPPQQQGGLGALSGLLKGVMGGGQPQPQAPMQLSGGQPQPPMGGQPQAPMGGAPQPAPQPQGQPQGGGGVPPQFQTAAQQLDFPTLTKSLAQMPGMTPQRLMAALSALQPYMNLQSQLNFKQIQERVMLQNAQSGSVRAGAAQENADTNAATRPIMAGASKERADTGAKNEASLEKTREAKIGIDQAKLDQGGQHLQLIEKAATSKDVATAETNYRQLINIRANALLAAQGDTEDATVKGLDAQIATADKRVQELHAATPTSGGKRTGKVTVSDKPAPEGGDTTQGAPKAGDVMQGYRFKGGDPAKKENWEKV